MTTPRPTDDASHWRQRAAQTRAQAAAMDEERRLIMLRIAAQYDLLAERAEGRRNEETA